MAVRVEKPPAQCDCRVRDTPLKIGRGLSCGTLRGHIVANRCFNRKWLVLGKERLDSS